MGDAFFSVHIERSVGQGMARSSFDKLPSYVLLLQAVLLEINGPSDRLIIGVPNDHTSDFHYFIFIALTLFRLEINQDSLGAASISTFRSSI